jgi:hypothetical protein
MRRAFLRIAVFLRDRYLAVDARSLGLFRIVFGLHLLVNLYDRTRGSDGIAFYTNDGLYPNHYALFAPLGDMIWSFLFPFSRPAEVQVAFFFIAAVYVLYVLGYKTKLAQVLAVVCVLSLDNRNLILQNGGIVVTNLVTVWTAFLPLGARFSLDHLLLSLRRRRESTAADLADRRAMVQAPERFFRVAFLGLLVNFSCIYFFNFAHKRGVTWQDGSAVHWVLWQNRIATAFAAWLRMHEPWWLSPAATYGTLAIEASLPAILLFPWFERWTRRIAIVLIFLLHGGIALTMTLGPFSYSIMAFSLLLLGAHDWDLAGKMVRRTAPKVSVLYDASNPTGHAIARLLARLDVRRSLAFADIPEPHTTGGEDFVVRDDDRLHTGAMALARAVSALPCGPAFAWPLRLRVVRRRIDQAMHRRGSLFIEATSPLEAPVHRFVRNVKVALGDALATVLLFTIVQQVGSDNWIIPERYRVKSRPEFMREIIEYLRLPQGWSMFSPEAPKDDGTIVIDAVLSDGRHIDPRKQRPPDFEAAFHGPWWDDQQWCDWDLRMRWDASRHIYPYFRDYIARLDQMDSWKESARIERFDVFWVGNAAPPPGSTRPFDVKRQLLFSGGRP